MRKLLVVAALAACVALVLLLRHDGTPPRAPPRHGLLEGETLRDLSESAAETGPEREPPEGWGRVGAAIRRDAEGNESLDPVSRSGTVRVPEHGLAILEAR